MGDRIVLIYVAFIFFAAVFFSSISIFRLLKNKGIKFDKGIWFSLSACLVALLLSLSLWPAHYHVYEDEYAYVSQSINILSSGKADTITKGRLLHPEAFVSWKANSKLPGYSWLESVILFLSGNFDKSFFILNIILRALLVAVIFRISWILTSSYAVAWWSAVFLASFPVRISYSMSAACDIAGVFFFFLFFLFVCEYKCLSIKTILYAALFCGIYSICIKPFYGVFVIWGLATALYFYKRKSILDPKTYLQIMLDAFFLLLPIAFSVPVFFITDLKANGYSLSFIIKNILITISYLFNYEQNTFLTTFAALFAITKTVLYKKEKLVIGLALWLVGGILMISIFFAGGISNDGQGYSDRYFLCCVLPFVLLAAIGVVNISTIVRSRLFLGLIFIILVCNAYSSSLKNVASLKQQGFYKKISLLQKMDRLIPDDAYVIDESASFVAIETAMKPIQTSVFLNGDHPMKVVFLKGMSDFSYPYRTFMVENILNREYHCLPIASTPFKESDLSATPILCTRK